MIPAAKGKNPRYPMRVLAIESSCDESAAAVLDSERGLMAHELYSQIDLHQIYGGVVPELASRDHIQRLLPLIDRALERSATTRAQLDGVYGGPGLDRRFAHGCGVSPLSGECMGLTERRYPSSRGASAGAAARGRPAVVPSRGLARLRGAHDAHRGARGRRVSLARRDSRRCRG